MPVANQPLLAFLSQKARMLAKEIGNLGLDGLRRYLAAGLGAATATGGRIDLKRSIILRPIKTHGRGASG
jgi:hypothetical protein